TEKCGPHTGPALASIHGEGAVAPHVYPPTGILGRLCPHLRSTPAPLRLHPVRPERAPASHRPDRPGLRPRPGHDRLLHLFGHDRPTLRHPPRDRGERNERVARRAAARPGGDGYRAGTLALARPGPWWSGSVRIRGRAAVRHQLLPGLRDRGGYRARNRLGRAFPPTV